MPLHPQAQTVVDLVNAGAPPSTSDEQLDTARAGLGMLLAAGVGTPPEMHAVQDVDADGVPVRVYRPTDETALPTIVFLHGGGWTIGCVNDYDGVARTIAHATNAVVVSVEYRLAPEHPFPAGYDDCWTALNWAAKHAPDFGGDGSKLVLMGDSAGGNLTAVCALRARDAGGPELALQVLIYPVTDYNFDGQSYRENGTGYLLEQETMRWFVDCYTRGGADPSDPRISPLQADDLRGVAPALVITAEFDPLRDEGAAYAERLQEAGVPTTYRCYDGMIHIFFGLVAVFDDGRAALDQAAAAIADAVGDR